MVNQSINSAEKRAAKERLEQFEAVGGFVFSDGETVTVGQKILDCSVADQAAAQGMIADITADRQRTVH